MSAPRGCMEGLEHVREINAVERTLTERIHGLEIAFARAGIDVDRLSPTRSPAPAPGQQGRLDGPADR